MIFESQLEPQKLPYDQSNFRFPSRGGTCLPRTGMTAWIPVYHGKICKVDQTTAQFQ